MDIEERVFKLRGESLEDYLISESPNNQLFMELYLRYIHDVGIFEHGKLLFSEVLLCNKYNAVGFTKKIIGIEKNNIKKIIKSEDYDSQINYKDIYDILSKRYANKKSLDNSNTNLIEGIMDSYISFISGEDIDDALKGGNNLSEVIKKVKALLAIQASNFESIEILHLNLIAYREYLKLYQQKRSLLDSFKNSSVDYSFYDKKNINKVKSL